MHIITIEACLELMAGLSETKITKPFIVLDRDKQLPVVMASVEGGIDIEEVAVKSPDKILKIHADPITGIGNWQARKLAFGLGLKGKQVSSCCKFILNLYKLFINLDCSIVEINPLVVTSNDNIISLRLDDFSFLLSLISECKDLYLVKSKQHAVDTNGPAHEPLPASSTPIIIISLLYRSLSIS